MSTKSIVNPSGSMSVENSNSTTFYALRPANVNDVFDYINGLTIEGVIQSAANDPASFITSIRIYPFDFNTTDSSHVVLDNNIVLGKYDCQLDSGAAGGGSVECYRLTNGYKTHFNLGTYTFTPHFNSFLDYSPYTKYELYLPYCGFVDMDATEYTGKTISIDYILDYTQGSCLAVVSDITNENNHVVLFSKRGIIGIRSTGSVFGGIPSVEFIVFTCKGIGSQACFVTNLKPLLFHFALSAIGVKSNRAEHSFNRLKRS